MPKDNEIMYPDELEAEYIRYVNYERTKPNPLFPRKKLEPLRYSPIYRTTFPVPAIGYKVSNHELDAGYLTYSSLREIVSTQMNGEAIFDAFGNWYTINGEEYKRDDNKPFTAYIVGMDNAKMLAAYGEIIVYSVECGNYMLIIDKDMGDFSRVPLHPLPENPKPEE